ncbi:MAG: DNA adenine methylase [Thermocladium sp.]
MPILRITVTKQLKPILKWAGGKRQILPYLLQYIKDFNNYYEPFAGGLALLIELYNRGRIKKAIISDINKDLINLYEIIKEKPYELISAIKEIPFKNNKDDYYQARKLFNSLEPHKNVSRAALLLYLNRHGYNGLYRVSSKGEFNVPFGRYNNPSLPDEEDIIKFHEILKSCEILNLDFEDAVRSAQRSDFVYFDPPYMPLNETSYFTDYTSGGFSEQEQKRLASVFKKLSNKGVYVMQSNSNNEFIRQLYAEYNIVEIEARRNINSNASKRGPIKELLVLNYQVK